MSCARAIDVTDLVHSLTEPSIIVCECASMIPGKHELAGGVNHARSRRCAQVLTDGGDLAVADQDVCVLQRAM